MSGICKCGVNPGYSHYKSCDKTGLQTDGLPVLDLSKPATTEHLISEVEKQQQIADIYRPREVRTVSSTGGEKGTKLARYDLIPAGPLHQLAEHYGKGGGKYEDRNWERGYEWSKNFASLNRHLWAWWGGEDIDEETGSNHLAAVAWHAFALLEFTSTHPDFDDRPNTRSNP